MQRAILYAIPMAFMWTAIIGQEFIASFILGYILSVIILWGLFWKNSADIRLFRSLRALVQYIFRVLWDLVVADLRVAGQIISGKHIDSQIIEVPLANDSELDDDLVAALSSHAITLTPGTLVIDVDEERNVLILHRLDARDTDDKLDSEQHDRADLIRRIFHND